MRGLEEIKIKGKSIAIIFRNHIKVKGTKFFTEDTNPFQVGIQYRKKGDKVIPHTHRIDSPLTVEEIQEILFIQKGKIKLTLYTEKKEILSRKILNSGDAVLLLRGPHQVDFLEDTKIFELKQGPYPGAEKAKTYI